MKYGTDDKQLTNVIIYGAGKIGRLLYDVCKARSINIVAIWDNNPTKVIQFPRKDLISKPSIDNLKTQTDVSISDITVMVSVFSPDRANEMAQPLLAEGFRDVIYDRSEISSLLIGHCNWKDERSEFEFSVAKCFTCPARRDEKVECNLFNKQMGVGLPKSDVPVVLPSLGVLITTKCNLTCVGCNHLRDHFEPSDNVNFSISRVLEDIIKIVDSADFIKSLVIVGGEPFIHPDFAIILEELLELKKVGFIQIITNGTVKPRGERVMDLLANPRVVIEVSGYGEEPGIAGVRKRDVLFKELNEAGAYYRYDEATQWFDFGSFEKRNYKPQQWRDIYDNCCFVSNDLFDGKLHKCSRSAYGQFLEKTPEYKRDYVDVRNLEGEALRAELERFIGMAPAACLHCNGTQGQTIPAGVQVERIPVKVV